MRLLPGFVLNNTVAVSLGYLPSRIFSECFLKVQVMKPNSITKTASVWKNSCFNSSKRLDFHLFYNLLIAIDALLMRLLTLLSVEEILLPRYMS